MHWNRVPGLTALLAMGTALFTAPALAQTCGPNAMSVKANSSAQYIITQCPATPEATFTILEPGSASVASIALTHVEGSEGTFRVDGVAPGETTFRIEFRGVVAPQRSSECNLKVAVTGD